MLTLTPADIRFVLAIGIPAVTWTYLKTKAMHAETEEMVRISEEKCKKLDKEIEKHKLRMEQIRARSAN